MLGSALCLRTLARFSFQPRSPDQFPDVKAAICQPDRLGFRRRQKSNGLAIYRVQICEVEDNAGAFLFRLDQRSYFRHVFCVQLTADLKDHFTVCPSRDPQHLAPRRHRVQFNVDAINAPIVSG